MYPSTSSRWCPTPEQLMILEEMYRGGIRTPKAAQIQAITAHLSNHGKIEGKNVFYWFQNHKARDRQKLRRKLMMAKQNPIQHNIPHYNFAQPQLYYYVPVDIVPQVGSSVNVSPQMMTYSVKVDTMTIPDQRCDTKEPAIRMDGCDWVVLLDNCPTSKPLKTLELFPTTPSGDLKNEPTESSENSSSTTTPQATNHSHKKNNRED